jgi:hypothetical protein
LRIRRTGGLAHDREPHDAFLPLAASIGDPAGVGPELFCAAWALSGAEALPRSS